ncbi:hypothetical protein Tco_0804078 [Tanacetum coccineum]|uniref:Uncharacterized protein n=1 Tax=Tanacetum coccineum TaxID=301880 RepID=A0ABQ5A3C0_9ASTR
MAPRGRPTRTTRARPVTATPPPVTTTPPPVTDPTTTTSVTNAQLQAMIDEGVTAVLAARATLRSMFDLEFYPILMWCKPEQHAQLRFSSIDIWDPQARMVKSEETNRQHADHIEKLRAKERQQVFIISEQAQAISKQAETLSKQGETLSKQAEMISFLTRKLLEKNSPQENQSQSSQQAFSQLQQQMQLIQLSNPSLMPQQNIQGARLQVYPKYSEMSLYTFSYRYP